MEGGQTEQDFVNLRLTDGRHTLDVNSQGGRQGRTLKRRQQRIRQRTSTNRAAGMLRAIYQFVEHDTMRAQPLG